MSYSRGSEWRRWDLHLHTPKSVVQNYGGDTPQAWGAFIKAIQELPSEQEVIAVTDYLFIDGYQELLKRRSEIPNIKLIIPNIEFRLNVLSGTSGYKRLNYHILFDPTVSPEVIQSQFLNGITQGYRISDHSEWNMTPDRQSLAQLGKDLKSHAPQGNTIHSKSDLEAGFDNITYKLSDLEQLLKKSCFQGKYLTAVGYAEWDQMRWDQSAAEKRSMISSVDFILSAQADPAVIQEHSDKLKEDDLTNLILHSSDAHEIAEMDASKLWIKADPTFSGLKQVINETERAFIGVEWPNYKQSREVIHSVSMKNSNGWFSEDAIPLNRDMVSIIGGRGSGKSALAEMIAYAGGSVKLGKDSFISKASKHAIAPITNTSVVLEWEDGHKSEAIIGTPYAGTEQVRYLSQKAVEELCSPENEDQLLEQIENVIFQSLDETQRLEASSFSELKEKLLSTYNLRKQFVRREITNVNESIHEIRSDIDLLCSKRQQLVIWKEQLETITKELPKLLPEEVKDQDYIDELRKQKSIVEQTIVKYRLRKQKLDEIKTRKDLLGVELQSYKKDIEALLGEAGLESKKNIFDVDFKGDVDGLLRNEASIADSKISTLLGGTKDKVALELGVTEDTLYAANYNEIAELIKQKEQLTKTHETRKLQYQQQKNALSDLQKKIDAQQKEITESEHKKSVLLPGLITKRLGYYKNYFVILIEEKSSLEALYEPLQVTLSDDPESGGRLEFKAKVRHRLNTHVQSALGIIDRSRKGEFRDTATLSKALSTLEANLIKGDYSPDAIEAAVSGLEARFYAYNEEEKLRPKDQIRESYTEEDFDNWLFDPSYFEIISSIEFDGTELYILSPGQKGIVLLMLYLAIDKEDKRPLIIDQPEDNLDNLSVYHDLLHLFRKRKIRRQIIIITHNPNLVVNTDSEQVVIANFTGEEKPRIKYIAGSLEDHAKEEDGTRVEDLEDKILENVCNILEGGKGAFNSRDRKYKVSIKL